MPLPLPVSLLYVAGYRIVRRKRPPFAGKNGGIRAASHIAVVCLGFALFLAGGILPPLSLLADRYTPFAMDYAIFAEIALLPFTVSAVIYGVLRPLFRIGRGTMKDYIDYCSITYYVSMTIIATYGLLFMLIFWA